MLIWLIITEGGLAIWSKGSFPLGPVTKRYVWGRSGGLKGRCELLKRPQQWAGEWAALNTEGLLKNIVEKESYLWHLGQYEGS